VIDYDSPRQSSSRTAGRASKVASSSRAYDDSPEDDDEPLDFGDHPSFDLSAMAGDDDAAAAPSDAGSADETMRLPRAPAAGLAARRAAQERTQLGHRSVREASTESAAELSGELLEEIIEPDVGEEALEYTSAGQWDVHEARKGSSVSPVKGKTSKKAAAVGDETDAPARPRARPKAGKSAAKASSSAPAKARAPAKGKKRAVEESDSSGSEYDAAPPLRVEKRTVQRTKATGGKRGPTSVVQQQVVERIPSAYHRGTSEESEGGVRRSGRYRYQPLEYWRGERARFGRPSMPAVREHAEDEEPIDGDAFERLPGKSYGAPPVPVLKEIVRIPRAEGEGTFAGMKRPRAKSAVPAGGNKPVVKRRKAGSVDEEVEFELDPTAPTVHPEDGWDKDTEPHGLVWDVDAESEVSRRKCRPLCLLLSLADRVCSRHRLHLVAGAPAHGLQQQLRLRKGLWRR
jgi:centromere protein C